MRKRQGSIVFRPHRIGRLGIKNRLVRSATHENAATRTGEVSAGLVDCYRHLAKGGIGLIITGAAGVDPKGIRLPNGLRADDDSYIRSLERIPLAVRQSDPECRIMLQLAHPGRQILAMDREQTAQLVPFIPPAMLAYMQKHPEEFTPEEAAHKEVEATAPSAVYDTMLRRIPRALSLEEIEQTIDDFVSGIRRAKESCFDGAQLHAAHGYLLSSFLSPRTNRREDAYGGSTENRTRIVREIYHKAIKLVGDDFPILIKINTTDFLPGGIDLDEAVKIGRLLCETGFAGIETSGGMWEALMQTKEELGWSPVFLPESRIGINTKEQEGYFLPAAKALKKMTDATILLVGGLRSFSRIQEVLESGAADFVSLCRPLIRQPDLPNLWSSGDSADKAECVSCNACLPMGISPLACRARRE